MSCIVTLLHTEPGALVVVLGRTLVRLSLPLVLRFAQFVRGCVLGSTNTSAESDIAILCDAVVTLMSVRKSRIVNQKEERRVVGKRDMAGGTFCWLSSRPRQLCPWPSS